MDLAFDTLAILLLAYIVEYVSQNRWGNIIVNIISTVGILFWLIERYSNISTG